MLEHPYIDFNGDGHGDSYDTVAEQNGAHQFLHHDGHGHLDAIAFDDNHDGRIDRMLVDDTHDGTFDRMLTDTNGDGIMDRSAPTNAVGHPGHPYVDFDGDGHGDRYYAAGNGRFDTYYHVDGHGQVDREAVDIDRDGRIDEMYVDTNHDGRFDVTLKDTNGDGIMDTRSPYAS